MSVTEADEVQALFGPALDENRGDRVTLLALADWHEERGDCGASACLRWAARLGVRPGDRVEITADTSFPVRFRYFWTKQDENPIFNDPPAVISPELWAALRGHTNGEVVSYKTYETAYDAWLDLTLAWRVVAGI